MGATSVTGVSGAGSVAGKSKGSEHMSLSVSKLIGPKVAAAGQVTLSGTNAYVRFPALAGSVGDYVVILTNNSATNPHISSILTPISNTDDWRFEVTAGSGDIVSWAVINTGLTSINIPG
jgi:hypothetical protein